MPDGSSSIRVRPRVDPARGWLVIWLRAGYIEFEASLTFCPRFWVGREVRDELTSLRLTEPTSEGRYMLHQLRLGRQAIPDLEVGFSRRLDRLPLGVGVILGMDFLSQFTAITLDEMALGLTPQAATLRLTFIDP